MVEAGTVVERGRWWRNEFLWAFLVLTGLTLAFFNPVFRHDATFSAVYDHQRGAYPWVKPEDRPRFTLNDQADYVYPRQVFLHRTMKTDGQVPLWNPLTFGGHPFFAESGSRMAYPPFLALSYLFSPALMHDIYLMLHFVGAGLAMFALMKHFRLSFAGALLAAVAWAFNSYAMVYAVLEMYPGVGVFFPLVILAIHLWHERRSWSWLLVGGLLLGVLYVATSAELAFLAYLFAFAYAGVLAVTQLVRERDRLDAWRVVTTLAAPCVLVGAAVAVAAVEILPFVQLSGVSGGEPLRYSELIRQFPPMRVGDLAHLFVPPDIPVTIRGISQQLFLGTATAILALVGLFTRRRGAALGRAAVVAIVIYAIGGPGTWLAYQVPGLDKVHGVGRSFFILDLGLAMLAGIGLDRVLGWAGARVGRDRIAVVAGLAAACILTVVGQLFAFAREVNPPFQPRDPAFLLPPTPATEAASAVLGRTPGGGRVLPALNLAYPRRIGYTLPAATAMALDLPITGGYEPILPERSLSLWRLLSGEPVPAVLGTKLADAAINAQTFAQLVRVDLLAKMGVSSVLGPPNLRDEPGWDRDGAAQKGLRLDYSGPDGVVYEVVNRTPRAFVVPSQEVVRSGSAAESLRRFDSPEFDVRREVILEGRPAVSGVPSAGGAAAAGSADVRWLDDDPNEVRLRVESPVAGWLVLLDNWDPGWTATVGGKRADVLRANYGFRAVAVPAGTSVVAFAYRPPAVLVGFGISAVAVPTLLALIFWAPLRRETARDLVGRLRSPAGRKVLRYSLASVLNVLIGQVVLVVMFGFLHWSAQASAVLAACLAALPAYVVARRWVWGRSGRSHLLKEVLPFWALALAGLALTTWAAGVAERWGEDLTGSRPVQTAIVMVAVLVASGLFWIARFVILNRVLFADRPS